MHGRLIAAILLLLATTAESRETMWLGSTPIYARDWAASFDALWDCEGENSGDAAGDKGIDGQDDLLASTGSTTRNTSTFRYGRQSCGVSDSANRFTCADGTCTGIDPAAQTSFTYGGAVYLTADENNQQELLDKGVTALTDGYTLSFRPNSNNNVLRCQIGRTGGGVITEDDSNTNSTSTWYWIACAAVDPAGGNTTLTGYRNNVSSGTTSHADAYEPTSQDARVGTNLTGVFDDLFFIAQDMTSAERSRIASCGVRGEACVCADATSANYKPCGTNADCGGTGVCDTGAGAIDDDNCVEGSFAGCCLGYNSTLASGTDIDPCNDTAP